ncbi:precorrin-2 C20-methyltransferase [Thiorhodovibrio frisius]|uniref:Precorrin-2 C20-methyltransferase n=1 Tax=Thiorhodovibrio frisius TaxID=631362 RepID=H8Z038_9GAMM|nr:precorrin-2 C20-methyltransferase [Thiorhodovibrio frisius]WPL23787.1 Precorrin-3B C(17)-methyltransferase [Thiorhodovibrio frisius]
MLWVAILMPASDRHQSGMASHQPEQAPGRLIGLGVGPGDPELMTLKALRRLREAPVVAYYAAENKRGNALTTVAEYLRPEQRLIPLIYPITGKIPPPPFDYEGVMRAFYDHSAETLAEHLSTGIDVAVLCEGDPFFYGSFMYLHDRLVGRFPTEVVAGVCSVVASASALRTPLVYRDQSLLVLSGTLPEAELRSRLTGCEAAAVMKLGTNFAKVRRVITELGLLERARYVERATMSEERIRPLPDITPASVPYFAMILIPGETWPAIQSGAALVPVTTPEEQREALADEACPDKPTEVAPDARDDRGDYRASRRSLDSRPLPLMTSTAGGQLTVVGLGPGAQEWLTPQARAAIDQAEDLLGYETYLRLAGPFRPEQRVHPSDNRQELDRARAALELAASGRRVALLSSGDPGIFAMASAVFEVLDRGPQPEQQPAQNSAWNPAWQQVTLEILPGISAAQALAARVGAPLGHDFCILSLSDNLKPWTLIEQRLRLAAEADLVLALYNPRSRARPDTLGQALEILRALKAPTTPVALGHDVGRADERTRVLTLATLDPETVDMRTVLIIGSSRSRVLPRAEGGDWLYTPRWSQG